VGVSSGPIRAGPRCVGRVSPSGHGRDLSRLSLSNSSAIDFTP
jgi:hypothetical protein